MNTALPYDPDLDHWRWPNGSYVDRNGVMRHADGTPTPWYWTYIDLSGVRRFATGIIAPQRTKSTTIGE